MIGAFRMIHDIHSHTYYSMCGRDDPHLLAETALHDGIEVLGISDHNYGIRPERYEQYCAEIHALRDEFADRLKILCGIEVNTLPYLPDPSHDNRTIPDSETLSAFDYCLVEHLDHPDSVMQGDILAFAAITGHQF